MVTISDTLFGRKTHKLASVGHQYRVWGNRNFGVIVASKSAVRHRELGRRQSLAKTLSMSLEQETDSRIVKLGWLESWILNVSLFKKHGYIEH